MNAPPQQSVLRPLGVGEILDRAVNLCVRNFGILALINVVFIVPAAIVQFQAQKNLQLILDAIQVASKNSSNPDVLKTLSNGPQPSAWLVLGYFAIIIISPLTSAALVYATSNAYFSKPATFAESYAVALRNWLPILGVLLLYFMSGAALYLAVILVVVVIALAVGVLYSLQAAVGVTIGVILGLIFLAILVVALTVVILAWQVTIAAIVIERMNFALAFVRGLTRVLARPVFTRSLLAGFAFLAVLVGITAVDAMGEALIVGLLKNVYVGIAYGAAIRIVTAAFTTAFVVIFYYDLRVREEGLDLTMVS